MKKMSKLIAILLIATIGITEVNASDLTSRATATDSLGGITNFNFTYDATNDINNLAVELTINETLINTVLSQAPGNASSAASLGRFVFKLNPGLDQSGYTFKKNKVYYSGNVLDAKTSLDPTITTESPSNYSSVWPVNLNIQYYDGTTWKDITDQSNGGKTIKANLLEKLSITESELKYGKNFRFFIDESESILWGFEPVGPSGSENREYISISYKTNFPITAVVDDNNVYYPNLKDALLSGANKVILNENTTLDEDLEIPKNVTLKINQGITLTIDDNVTLKNNGNIENNGTILSGRNELYTIVGNATNGILSFNSNLAKENDTIKITATAKDGYKLETLKVVDITNNEEIDVTDNEFVMPDGNVVVTANFVEDKKSTQTIEVPETIDSVSASFITLMLGISGIIGLIVYRKKLSLNR